MCGIVSSHLEPTGIRVRASIQPAITPLTGNSAGSPRATGCRTRGAVDQLTGVVHANVVSACRDSAVATVDHAELQARLPVLFTPSRSRFSSRYFTPSAAISSKRARRTASARSWISRSARCTTSTGTAGCFAFQRQRYPPPALLVTDLRAGFAQLLSYLQADTVTCLRFDSVKSRGWSWVFLPSHLK